MCPILFPAPHFTHKKTMPWRQRTCPMPTQLVPKFQIKTVTPTTLVCSQKDHVPQNSDLTRNHHSLQGNRGVLKLWLHLHSLQPGTLVSLWRKWPRQSGRGVRELGPRQEWEGLSPSCCLYVCDLKVCITYNQENQFKKTPACLSICFSLQNQ